jgi:hypothetical protein
MTLRPGFPIRKSTDQRLLAPPRGLSQRATSFIASQCQGIHQMPLSRLIQSRRPLDARPPRHSQHFSNLIMTNHGPCQPRYQTHAQGDQSPRTRIGNLRSSSDFTGPRQGCDPSAHDHGKTPVAGRLHPINNVKQQTNRLQRTGRPNLFVSISQGTQTDPLRLARPAPIGGADRDRTDDLLLAKQALSQLSYGPDLSAASSSVRMFRRCACGGPGKI